MSSSDSSCPALDAVSRNHREAANEAEMSPSESEPSRLASNGTTGNYREAANHSEMNSSWSNSSADFESMSQTGECSDEDEPDRAVEGAKGVYSDDENGYTDEDLNYSDADEEDMASTHNDDGDDDVISLFHYGCVTRRPHGRHAAKRKRDNYLSDGMSDCTSDGMSDGEDNLPIRSESKKTKTEEDTFNDIMDDYIFRPNYSYCSD